MGSIKEIHGVKFIEPEGYKVKENGIYQLIGPGSGPSLHVVSRAPLFITGRSICADTGKEKVEIAFKRDGNLRKMWVNRSGIYVRSKLIKLSNYGFPVTSINVSSIIGYLAAFEAANMGIIKIRSQYEQYEHITDYFI